MSDGQFKASFWFEFLETDRKSCHAWKCGGQKSSSFHRIELILNNELKCLQTLLQTRLFLGNGFCRNVA